MHMPDRPQTGTLYIVATPIGNLEDITLRAVRILGEVDLIAAEDTRHTKKLLNHLRIETQLISYYREREKERAAELIERLKAGITVALVTDAGTPGISDPGAILVKDAHEAGITVTPIPGPSALTAAISASGLDCSSFLFLGFCPAREGQRRKFLSSIANSLYPVVLYESPHRIRALLADALEILGNRPAFWARELTKIHEDLQEGSLSQLLDRAENQTSRGESALIVSPAKAEPVAVQSVDDLLVWYRDHSGLSLKDACKRLSADLGISRSLVYQKALRMWQAADSDSRQ
ncbi:MAG: 16S rRNA (cytidine(1402)-2'-O)-methyltransferase [Desulfocapsaceae bacterium]|nr:16S rRNA (cytidine(1402)-2'-O)-methyltransferase [Desulfocapsaceae bacterium]